MLLSLISAIAILQSGAQSDAGDLTAPPIRIRKGPECVCPAEAEEGVIIIKGVVVDAELTLAPDGRSANERQATIFTILPSASNEIEGRTRIWHSSNPAQCGVTFNYGVTYELAVRKLETGALETDACLMRGMRPAAQ